LLAENKAPSFASEIQLTNIVEAVQHFSNPILMCLLLNFY
jgi:hypothetical protein